MAKLLVFQRDNYNPIDDSGSYKTGDIIAVKEDSHIFSAAELKYPFKEIQLSGVAADYTYLLEAEPATIIDKYPRVLAQIKRLIPKLAKECAREQRGRRKYACSNTGIITRKLIGGP